MRCKCGSEDFFKSAKRVETKTGRLVTYSRCKKCLVTTKFYLQDINVVSKKKADVLNDDEIKVVDGQVQVSLDTFTKIKTINTINLSKDDESKNLENIAVIVASDWHVEETVNKESVNDVNEFNIEICKRRISNFFNNSIKLINLFSSDCRIDTVVFAILGDFINNNLHEEALIDNSLSPTNALIFVQNQIASGIELLLKQTDKNFVCVCAVGNHSRITKFKYKQNAVQFSLEYLMYNHLKDYFKSNDRVEFIINNSYQTYLNIPKLNGGNFVIRFHHGDEMRYFGGVGGLTIPVNKSIAQWNKIKVADLDIFGHFHQFLDGGNFVANGSLIGYNSYALSIKASFEQPKQTFLLINENYGKTVVAPIFLD